MTTPQQIAAARAFLESCPDFATAQHALIAATAAMFGDDLVRPAELSGALDRMFDTVEALEALDDATR